MNRCAFAVIAAVLFASVASAFDPLDVTTLDGQTYKQVNSARIVGDKALLTYADGVASVSLKALSDGVREKLGIGALDALTAENKTLLAELKKKELRIAALEKENADLRAKLTGNAGTIPLLHPLLDQPNYLKNLYTSLNGKQVASGFISRPLRIGVTGYVESVFVERIVDKTNMVARIRFPEFRVVEMAPGSVVPSPGYYAASYAWQTGDELVWIAGIDTSGLVDKQLIFLTEPLKVTGTVGAGGATIFRLTRAEKAP